MAPRMAPAAMTAEELRRFVEATFGPPTAVVTPDSAGKKNPADRAKTGKQATGAGDGTNAKGIRTKTPYETSRSIVVERGETVRSRVRPEYEARGLRTGGVMVYPEFDVSELYDDNIFRDPTDEEGDFITVLQPRLRVVSNWNNHALSADLGAELGFYAANPDENYQDFHARLGGRLDVTSDSQLLATVSAEKLHDDRGSPDDTDALDPTEYYAYSIAANYAHRVGRIRYSIGGELDRRDYLDNERLDNGNVVDLNNDDRDRLEALGRARVAYLFRPESQVYVESRIGRLMYDSELDDAGTDREALTYRAIVGIASDFDGIISADLHAGYQAKDFDDPAFGVIDGPSFGGTVTWNVTPLTTVIANAEQTISPTTIQNASGALVTRAGITVDHELLRNVIVQLRTQWRESDYDGIDRTDDTLQVGLGADVLVNRNLTFSAQYSHGERLSDAPDAEYSQNLFSVGLKTKF